MAGRIQVTAAPTAFAMAAGNFAEATVTVRNLGQTVDQFRFSIDGLSNDWYDLTVTSIALFPNDQDNLKILIHPPRTADFKSGSYTFQLNVTSQESPDEKANVEFTVEVNAVPELKLEITPQRITGRRGTYKILVSNPTDETATLDLEAVDEEAILHYDLQP